MTPIKNLPATLKTAFIHCINNTCIITRGDKLLHHLKIFSKIFDWIIIHLQNRN